MLTIDLLNEVVAEVAVVRVQLTKLHGPVGNICGGNVGPLVCASRFCYFGNWVASYLALAVQVVLQPIVWPCLRVSLEQRRACLPRHHLVWDLLPTCYLSHPVNRTFSILNVCLSLGALFVSFVCHSLKVLVKISTSASFGLARLGDVREG